MAVQSATLPFELPGFMTKSFKLKVIVYVKGVFHTQSDNLGNVSLTEKKWISDFKIKFDDNSN